jgi:hypothetical protein
MKKTFPLEVPGLKAPRVIETIKRDVKRYIKRERGKKLPEEVDFWDFDCEVGKSDGDKKASHIAELNTAIDTAAKEQWPAIYVEILAKPGYRTKKEKEAPKEEGS